MIKNQIVVICNQNKKINLGKNPMILYKFRSLSSALDLDRAKQILETGHFWCSKFSELNDPMEGAFTILSDAVISDEFKSVYKEKSRYKICSFSGQRGFENPAMWGYYANGFKGICIRVEVEDESKIAEIKYEDEIQFIERIKQPDGSVQEMTIKKLLTTKLKSWEHENEFRFLIDSENNYHEVKKITGVYFGDPYCKFQNQPDILDGSTSLQDYAKLRTQLETIAYGTRIEVYSVIVNGSKVVPNSTSKPDLFAPPSNQERQSRRSEPR